MQTGNKELIHMARTRLDREQHAGLKTLLWGNIKRDNALLTNGAAKLGQSALEKMADVFDCSVDYLLGRQQPA